MRDLNRKKVGGVKPKASAAPKSLRPSARVMMLKNAGRVALMMLVAVAIGAGGGLGARNVYNFLARSPYFAIKSIEVDGVRKLDRVQILNMAGVQEGQNIFSLDAKEAVRRIASNPWIKGVTVRRQFPDRVIIRIVERQALSLVRRSGLLIVEEDGSAFKPAGEGDNIDMPIISGRGNSEAPDDPEAIARALEVIQLASGSGILPETQISEVIISPGGRMSLITIGVLKRVEMGPGDLKAQWAILETVLADIKRSGMEAARIDLNYPSGAAVKIYSTGYQTMVADRAIAKTGQ